MKVFHTDPPMRSMATTLHAAEVRDVVAWLSTLEADGQAAREPREVRLLDPATVAPRKAGGQGPVVTAAGTAAAAAATTSPTAVPAPDLPRWAWVLLVAWFVLAMRALAGRIE